MAKSHKTCMEQAEIIDTFGTYQASATITLFTRAARGWALTIALLGVERGGGGGS